MERMKDDTLWSGFDEGGIRRTHQPKENMSRWQFVCITEIKKRRQFRKFSYRGIDLDQYVHSPTPIRPQKKCFATYADYLRDERESVDIISYETNVSLDSWGYLGAMLLKYEGLDKIYAKDKQTIFDC